MKKINILLISSVFVSLSLFGCNNGNNIVSSSSSSSEEFISSSESILEPSSQDEENSSSGETPSSSSSTSEARYNLNPEDESLYDNQHYLDYVGDIQDVWDDYRGDNITIAVIDSGFDINHSEFKFADGSSKISDLSASFAYNGSSVIKNVGKNNVVITDGDSHGTICATVAAGSVTGYGTVGIAPNAKLLLLKTDKTPKAICESFKYAADNGAKVITISIGSYNGFVGDLVNDGSDLTTVFESSLKYAHDKGVVICSAAGNGGLSGRQNEYTYPGAASYVIGAGGLSDKSRTSIWSGSSYNSSKIYQFCDVFAPADNIYSGCSYYDGGQVYYSGGFNGTSFASPIIAGAAALYFDKYPNASNVDFERALFNTCTEVYPIENSGYGAIHIKNLMNYQIPSDAIKTIYFKDASWWASDNAYTSIYSWNYALTNETNEWPGLKMERVESNLYRFDLDTSIYERIIFVRTSINNEDWGAQTITLEASNFKNYNCYSISSTTAKWVNDGNYVTGTFINI